MAIWGALIHRPVLHLSVSAVSYKKVPSGAAVECTITRINPLKVKDAIALCGVLRPVNCPAVPCAASLAVILFVRICSVKCIWCLGIALQRFIALFTTLFLFPNMILYARVHDPSVMQACRARRRLKKRDGRGARAAFLWTSIVFAVGQAGDCDALIRRRRIE